MDALSVSRAVSADPMIRSAMLSGVNLECLGLGKRLHVLGKLGQGGVDLGQRRTVVGNLDARLLGGDMLKGAR